MVVKDCTLSLLIKVFRRRIIGHSTVGRDISKTSVKIVKVGVSSVFRIIEEVTVVVSFCLWISVVVRELFIVGSLIGIVEVDVIVVVELS